MHDLRFAMILWCHDHAITAQQFEVAVLVNSWFCRSTTFAVFYSLGLHN